MSPVDQGAYVVRTKDGATAPLVFGEDVLIGRNAGPRDHKVSAPLVFAGYGLSLPQAGVNDLAGLDLKGKIVVRFVVTSAGRVGEVSIESNSMSGGEDVAACIVQLIKRWSFPFKPEDDVPVSFPFVFTPGG